MVTIKNDLQLPLPFACSTCLYKLIGRCSGPVNLEAYLMNGSEVIPCTNIGRRQKLFNDLYNSPPSVPSSSNQRGLELPAFIPSVARGTTELMNLPPNQLVAISLTTLLGRKGDLLYKSITDLRGKLYLKPDVKVALVGTAKDWKIERLWAISDKYNMWQRISNFGFEFVTSLSYSVYDENPRATHIYNQDRNFMTHDAFANSGICSIPFLYPYQEEDYKFSFEWLRDRPDISTVAVLAQFCYTNRQFDQFLNSMHRIKEGVEREIRFLVVGLAKPERIATILKNFTATIICGEPFHKGLSGGQYLDDLTYQDDTMERTFSRPELIVENIKKYSQFCTERSIENRFGPTKWQLGGDAIKTN